MSEVEVEEVMANPGEDFAAADGARVAIGQTLAGRYLRVIYVPGAREVFVITAYDLETKLFGPIGAAGAENDEQTSNEIFGRVE